MKRRHHSHWKLFVVVGIFLILFTTTTVFAQESTEYPVASMNVDVSSVMWMPHVKYEGLMLTVSGPEEFYWQKLFRVGQNPYFNARLVGSVLQDGQYNYEIVVLPSLEYKTRDEGIGFVEGDLSTLKVQTGAFTVLNGQFVAESLSETGTDDQDGGSTILDQQILDDLIVDGSACIGFDCVNGESFGFDTIRLKENNLRIHFQDTSVSASFPSNDWRIVINDSANGGANYFAVEDSTAGKTPFKIEAGTRANALYVDDSGRVGLGTSTPAEDLHIWYGDTPTIRLHQSGSGWAPQTWDMAGNEANFFIRDVTNGSKLPFRIQPNTPSNTLTLKSDGKVGIGTWSPNWKMHIDGGISGGYPVLGIMADRPVAFLGSTSTDIGLTFEVHEINRLAKIQKRNSSGGWLADWIVMDYDTDNITFLENLSGNVGIGMVPTNSTAKLWVNGDVNANGVVLTSDVSAKENFSAVNGKEILALLAQMPISTWNFKSDETQTRHMGPTAQDFSKAFGLGGSDTTISIVDEGGVALAAIQGLNDIVVEKDAQIADLEARLSALEAGQSPKNQVSIITLLPWFLLTMTLIVLAWNYGKRQAQKNS